MLELWGMWSTLSLPSLPGPLWPRVVVPDRILSMGQIELFDIWTVYLCLPELFGIELFDHLTVCKQKLYLCWTKLFEVELFDNLTEWKKMTDV